MGHLQVRLGLGRVRLLERRGRGRPDGGGGRIGIWADLCFLLLSLAPLSYRIHPVSSGMSPSVDSCLYVSGGGVGMQHLVPECSRAPRMKTV